MKKAIIVDIDLTLLDSIIPITLKDKAKLEGRSDYWDEFYNNLDLVDKNSWCYQLIDQMSLINNLTVLFLTGREERARRITESFLKFKTKVNYELLMRQNGDKRDDAEIKSEYLQDILTKYEVLFAIDDKDKNCEVFKLNGIPTLKVF